MRIYANIVQLLKKHWLKGFLLLVAIGLRLVLAGITAHPDLLSISAGDFLLGQKGIVNIYEYLAKAPVGERLIEVYGRSFFTYPPLAYFCLGISNLLLFPFFGEGLYIQLLGGVFAFSGLGFSRDLLLLKLPYLIFDLLVAVLLFKVFAKEKKEAWLAFFLWLFNPVSWYTSFMVGQLDIIPTFLVVLSVYWVIKGRKELAAFSLGIGASLKIFPLFFLPVLILILGKNFWQRSKLLLIGFLPFLVTILPFLSFPSFRSAVVFSNQSQKMLFARIPVSGAEGIYLFIFGLVLIYLYTAYKGQQEKIWQYYLWVLLLFFSLTHYHPQWFIWITPFLIWELVENNFKHWLSVLTLFVCWLLTTLLFESSLSFGLFNPILPQLGSIPGLTEVLGKYTDPFQVKSIIRSIFAASAPFFGFQFSSPKKRNA